MNKNLLLIMIGLFIQYSLSAQSKLGLENYHYIPKPGNDGIVPVVNFEIKDKWYAGLRYNYEGANTLSFFTGKIVKGGKSFQYKFIPAVGISAGEFTGLSFAVNTDINWKKFYLSSQTQYSSGLNKTSSNFFFSWSELGYNISSHFFSGLAMQYIVEYGKSNLEPGFVTGITFNNFTVPLYVFSPFRSGCYFVAGLNYEYSFKKKGK